MKSNLPPAVSLVLLERALSASAEGITIADARLPDRPLIYCNDGFVKLTGYSRSETLGRNCRFLQGPATGDSAVSELREAVRAGHECVVELPNYRKDGSMFWNRLSITPVRDDVGTVTHFIGVQSDVTVRRNAEVNLRLAKERLQRINDRIQKDLELAARVQQSLLPTSHPSLPGLGLAWALEPCDELAGDMLGFRQISESELAVYVVDVSGHGVASSLLAVSLSHWFDQQLQLIGDAPLDIRAPVAVAEALNRTFPIDQITHQYFTMIYGVINVRSREFRYVCAGHPAPIHVPHGREALSPTRPSFPIGIAPEPSFEESVIHLASGDRLFLFTDGVVEAEDPNRAHFGFDRVMSELSVRREGSLDQTIEDLMSTVDEWRNRSHRDDDVTVVGVEFQ